MPAKAQATNKKPFCPVSNAILLLSLLPYFIKKQGISHNIKQISPFHTIKKLRRQRKSTTNIPVYILPSKILPFLDSSPQADPLLHHPPISIKLIPLGAG
jgi:hypothetical protein